MNADGHIRIKTKLDNSEIPKDLDEMVKELERLKQEQKELNDEAKKLDLNAKDYEKNANKIQAKIKELQEEQEKLKAFQEYSFNQEEYNDYGRQVAQKQQEIDLLKQEEKDYDEILAKLENVKYQIEENKELQQEWNSKIENLKIELAKTDSIKSAIGDIGDGIKGLLKKTLKWGLAVFSIRSAYMLVRQAVSTIAQYDKELATNIEYIRYALAMSLKPIIEWIVNAVYKLLAIFGGIIKAITGFNIFSKATAKNFRDIKSSAKSIKKSLAPFDEMNKLSDTNDILGIGGSLDKLKDLYAETEKMSKKIKDYFRIPTWDEYKQDLEKTYKPFIKWFEKNFITPVKNDLLELVELTKPVWQPFVEATKQAYKDTKDTFAPFNNWLNENIFKPAKNDFNKTLEDLKLTYAPFINTIIKWINDTFGIFGVKLDYIEVESKKTEKELENNLVDPLKETKKEAENLDKNEYNIKVITSPIQDAKNLLQQTWDYLKQLTSKKWNVKAEMTTTTNSSKANNWVDKLNAQLSKIGIKLQIPKLATGGIVNRPTFAQIGEAGREAIMPLDRNTEWMNELAKKINSNGGVVNVYLDGRLIQRQYNQRQEEFNFATNGGM